MSKRCCWNCVYGRRPQDRWLRIALRDWPAMLICSACAKCPGKTYGVYAGGYCRNFCPKPGVACDPSEFPVEPGEKICKIPLSQGLFALVDPEDYEELSRHKWCATRAEYTYYAARAGPEGRPILMHRVIMKTPSGMIVDHIYGNGLDNRKRYLRNGTKAQNSYNHRPPRGGTGFKGVRYIAQTGKYKATVGYQRRNIVVGEFDDPIEAAKARDRKAHELHGEFAYLNFPDDFAPEGGRDAGPNAKGSLRYVDLSGTVGLHARIAGGLAVI